MVIRANVGRGKHVEGGKHENSPRCEGYCGHCGTWRHKQRACRSKTTVAEEATAEPPNSCSNASSSANKVPLPLLFLNAAGTQQTTATALRTCHRCQRHEVARKRVCRASGGNKSDSARVWTTQLQARVAGEQAKTCAEDQNSALLERYGQRIGLLE